MCKQLRPLRLAILGYNLKQSIRGLRQIVENNAENVVRYVITRNEAYAVFKDDSSLIALSLSRSENYRGCSFDQLILFNDDRWLIEQDKCDVINRIISNTMQHSIVPEEWQIIKYEDVGE